MLQALDREVAQSAYLNRQEAAAYLNLPPRWLANNVRSGPRYVKVGRHVRYSVAALDAFMKAHEKGRR
jgi:excisionase family DNA binding protein